MKTKKRSFHCVGSDRQKKQNYRCRRLVAVVVNCRSVVNKTAELSGLIESVDADIVLGTESWLKPSIADSEVFPENYVVYRKDRPTAGGGVFLLVHSSLQSSAIDYKCNALESVWCKIVLSDNFTFIVGVVYRSPNSDISTVQTLYDILTEASAQTILLGGILICLGYLGAMIRV